MFSSRSFTVSGLTFNSLTLLSEISLQQETNGSMKQGRQQRPVVSVLLPLLDATGLCSLTQWVNEHEHCSGTVLLKKIMEKYKCPE